MQLPPRHDRNCDASFGRAHLGVSCVSFSNHIVKCCTRHKQLFSYTFSNNNLTIMTMIIDRLAHAEPLSLDDLPSSERKNALVQEFVDNLELKSQDL